MRSNTAEILSFIALLTPFIVTLYLFVQDLILRQKLGRPLDGPAGILIPFSIIFVTIPLIFIALLIHFIQYFKSRKQKTSP